MRGLRGDEREALIQMVGDPDHWLDSDDDAGEEVRDRLVDQGRATRVTTPSQRLEPGEDPDEWETIEWQPTHLGRLALRVCTGE